MRRLLLLFSLLLLAGCGAQPSAPAAAPAEDPNLGTYWCVSAVMDGMELGAQGQWLRLDENGEATLFLIHEPDTGRWSLTGPSFTMTIGGETIAAGTLENGVLTRLTPDEAITIDQLRERINDQPRVVLMGDGTAVCQKAFADLPQVVAAPPALRMQDAVGVALEAAAHAADGETVDAAALQPVYLRVPQAERELKAKQNQQ